MRHDPAKANSLLTIDVPYFSKSQPRYEIIGSTEPGVHITDKKQFAKDCFRRAGNAVLKNCAIGDLKIAYVENDKYPVNEFATYLLANAYAGEKVRGYARLVGWQYKDDNMDFILTDVPENAMKYVLMLWNNLAKVNAHGT